MTRSSIVKKVLLTVLMIGAVWLSAVLWPVEGPRADVTLTQQGVRFSYAADEKTVLAAWLVGSKMGDAEVRSVASLSTLQRLSLAETGVTHHGISALHGLTKLQCLDLAGTRLTTEAIAAIGRMSSLEQLNFEGCEWLRDEHLPALAKLTKLTRLNLTATSVTSAGMQSLVPLSNLNVLQLDDCPEITDDAVAALIELPSLRNLSIHGCGLTSLGYGRLCRSSLQLRLEGVTDPLALARRPTHWRAAMQGGRITESLSDLLPLAKQGGFRQGDSGTELAGRIIGYWGRHPPIEVQHDENERTPDVLNSVAEFQPGDFAILARLPDLRQLNLDGSNVTDEMLLELGSGRRLEYLSLRKTRVTDRGLTLLTDSPNLLYLDLAETNAYGTRPGFLAAAPNLQELSLAVSPAGELSEHFPSLPSLQHLKLFGPLTDAGIQRLPSLPKLGVLNIYDARIEGAGLARLETLPSLTGLFVRNSPLKDGPFIEAMLKVTWLRGVTLIQTGITREACERLRMLRPDLAIHWSETDASQSVRFE